jgi:hypothetical protein
MVILNQEEEGDGKGNNSRLGREKKVMATTTKTKKEKKI